MKVEIDGSYASQRCTEATYLCEPTNDKVRAETSRPQLISNIQMSSQKRDPIRDECIIKYTSESRLLYVAAYESTSVSNIPTGLPAISNPYQEPSIPKAKLIHCENITNIPSHSSDTHCDGMFAMWFRIYVHEKYGHPLLILPI